MPLSIVDPMDALDAHILRELGFEPFIGWKRRPKGLRASDVARHLGKNVRLVQDRIARMEADGVIAGYRVHPNPRHLGLDLTTYHVMADEVPDAQRIERLNAVDGFVGVVPFLGSGLCLTVSHDSLAQRDRRIGLIQELVGSREALPLYTHAYPSVQRPLTPLDWRLIWTRAADARRPIADVADEVGVTMKTARTRLARMREEGSIDEHVHLDFQCMTGILPFELAVWTAPGATGTEAALLRLFEERYLAHFRPPAGGYANHLLRIFAYTPAEIHSLAQQAAAIPGVVRTEPLIAAGAHLNESWLQELIASRLEEAPAQRH